MKLPTELYDKVSLLLDYSKANKISPYFRKKIVSFACNNNCILTDITDFTVLCLEQSEHLLIKMLWFCNNEYQREQILRALISYRDLDTIKELLNMTYILNEYFLKSRIAEAVDEGDSFYFKLLIKYVTLSSSEIIYLHDICWDENIDLKKILIKKLF